jgi:hypothetical protein
VRVIHSTELFYIELKAFAISFDSVWCLCSMLFVILDFFNSLLKNMLNVQNIAQFYLQSESPITLKKLLNVPRINHLLSLSLCVVLFQI